MEQHIYLIGMNHRTASIDVRECFTLTEHCSKDDWAIPLIKGIQESLILSTCNRVEILAVGDSNTPETILSAWAKIKTRSIEELIPHTYTYQGRSAISHLFSVASSLDSMVLGEPQILGQLKDAYKLATIAGASKTILNRLLHKAFSVAKRVRTETSIASNAVSISYAAVKLAKKIFGTMNQYKAMLIGAGEMAELAAMHLMQSGIQQLKIVNRTYSQAQELASQFRGEAIPFEKLFTYLAEVDIVISSTGAPQTIIHFNDIKAILSKRKHHPMLFIDIAVPRDIDPNVHQLDNIYLYDIDDLKEIVEDNIVQRQYEAIKAKHIIQDEIDSLCAWLQALILQPTIIDLRKRFSTYAEEELERTLKKIGPVDRKTREALETMIDALIRKLTHDPISYLKCAHRTIDTNHITLARQMFNLDKIPQTNQAVNED